MHIGRPSINQLLSPILISVSITRSPTGSIHTIAWMHSSCSDTSNGSRLIVFIPSLSLLPDINNCNSTFSGFSWHPPIVSSHHTRTVNDTVVQNQAYVYPGDPCVITPSHGRCSSSMTDLDKEIRSAIDWARGTGGGFLGASPITISSGSSLRRNIFVTPTMTNGTEIIIGCLSWFFQRWLAKQTTHDAWSSNFVSSETSTPVSPMSEGRSAIWSLMSLWGNRDMFSLQGVLEFQRKLPWVVTVQINLVAEINMKQEKSTFQQLNRWFNLL